VEPQVTPDFELFAKRLGARLRCIRILRTKTQRDLAENEYSVSYVSGVERGRIRPSLRAIEWLAARLDVPIADLLSDVDLEAKYAPTLAAPGGGDMAAGPVATARALAAEERLRDAQALLLQGDRSAAEQAWVILRSDPAEGRRGDGAPEGVEEIRVEGSPWTDWLGPFQRAERACLLARAYVRLGRGMDAVRAAEDGLMAAAEADDALLGAHVRLQLGNALDLMGSHEQAREQYTLCLEALDATGRTGGVADRIVCISSGASADPTFVLQVLAALGRQHQRLGNAAQAVEAFRHALAVSGGMTDALLRAVQYSERADRLVARGDIMAARSARLAAIAAFEAAEARGVVAAVQVHLEAVLHSD
jgi:transcriptional regulator with XRE-family HTH domain